MIKRFLQLVWNGARRVWQARTLLFLLLLLAAVVAHEGPPPGKLSTNVDRAVADFRFDLWGWEVEAVWAKFTHWLLQPQRYMPESERSATVRDYMTRIGRMQRLRWEITTLYTDPSVADPEVATAEMQAEFDELRAQVESRQPIVEAIIEEQVSLILSREGLGLLGQSVPPLKIHFTPLPYFLIISQRDHIATIHQQQLEPGLDVAQQEAIEEALDQALGVSSLVTAIGGMSAWPAMQLETSSLNWAVEVAAHEWTHHYLYLYPLGWEEGENYEARVINETTASIVDREIMRKVLAFYYPDLLPPEEPPPTPQPQEPTEPPPFDFRAEMHETRVEVDRLLADGQIEAAEQYMEERRQFFWENGYHIRKLNQAYFAFHGSYASGPGASGEDPIGPAVRQLREQSPSLRVFLSRVRGVTTLEALQAALDEL